MSTFQDITGKRYGRLVAIQRAKSRGHITFFVFQCDCGVRKEMNKSRVVNGITRSCGCLKKENLFNWKHGCCNTVEYNLWIDMKKRCHNPKAHAYKNYGARGIRVCDDWRKNFSSFLRDMGKRPSSDLSIGRIDNDGNYEPGNCRWETIGEQANNKRPSYSTAITYNGKTLSVTEWAKELGMKRAALSNRINRGRLSVEQALSLPDVTVLRSLTAFGETMQIADWSQRYGIARRTIRKRLRLGWSPEDAVKVPLHERYARKPIKKRR